MKALYPSNRKQAPLKRFSLEMQLLLYFPCNSEAFCRLETRCIRAHFEYVINKTDLMYLSTSRRRHLSNVKHA